MDSGFTGQDILTIVSKCYSIITPLPIIVSMWHGQN